MSEQSKMMLEEVSYPVLPLRNVVVFPRVTIPLFVGRQSSIQALNFADSYDSQVILVAQKDDGVEDPEPSDLYSVGTVATILQSLILPDVARTRKVFVQGKWRVNLADLEVRDGCYFATARQLESTPYDGPDLQNLMESVQTQFEQYVKHNQKIPSDVLEPLDGIESPDTLVDLIAPHLVSQGLHERQKLLEISDDKERMKYLIKLMVSDVEVLRVEKRIRDRVKKQMEKSQREYYLNEQMKAIQNELGGDGEGDNEFSELGKKIAKSGMTKEAKKKAKAELKKLSMMSPMSAEATVVRNYIDWLIAVPWKKRTKIFTDLHKAEEVLDNDHYGLEKVKERIVEYLAVQQRVKEIKGPILCLVGPPGVGKTSLGQSIARATNRRFIRMSLGGVRDEAEIRGHRRTYVGSLPGKIVQNLAKVKRKNPLFMLDEVDKMSMDFRGDPSSALLEVLDPEQNHTFGDHYLEVQYNLSEVMFIATANTLNIPPPLLDRMEVIRISGYTEEEKVQIAIQYLIPKQLKNNGLEKNEVSISTRALVDIVRYYTREAGVRALEREIAKICRKVAKKLVQNENASLPIRVRPRNLEKYLGVRQFRYGRADKPNQVGQVTGLAWTEVGGDLLSIEAIVVPGKGNHDYTGKLGKVMQESIKAAVSVVRSRTNQYGIPQNFYQKSDIHVHVPEGATPKDGPSAGVAMSVAIVSGLTKIPVRSEVAMTGEITLRGEVLAIGGLKEKLLAAHRGGIKKVLIPLDNAKDLAEIPRKIKNEIEVVPVQWIDEVIEHSLEFVPLPKEEIQVKQSSDPISSTNVDIRPH